MGFLKGLVSCVLLGILLMPSPRILDPERTHSRHATCEHHLRRHHPDPVERAKIIRRAERRKRRLEEQSREDAAAVAASLDESNLQPCQAAADPPDGDSGMKKGRRRPAKTRFWSLQEPPKVRRGGDFLAMLWLYLEEEDHLRPTGTVETLAHYGSGPCHSFPRPREGTVLHDLS